MRNSKTRSKTMKCKLEKCKSTFYAYNDIQYMFGKVVDTWSNIIEIKANVKLDDFILGDSYTTDFVCIKDDGELMVRECVFISKINKPMVMKMLDASREYWLSKGVEDWGIIVNAC